MPSSGRPGLIIASQPSYWTSNRLITPNLQAAYRTLWPDLQVYKLNAEADVLETKHVARQIASRRHDRLIFIDHLPHPGAIVKELAVSKKKGKLPNLDFHLYGDFTLQLEDWLSIEPFLKTTRVRWICASEKQAALVSRLVSSGIAACPFPVDPAQFSFDPNLRRSARLRFGLADEERVLVYTGRFSLQKNSIRLLREAARFMATANFPTRLLLAGSFDDIGAPFFGVRHLPGQYFQLWNRRMKSLPSQISRRIRYVGRLDCAELRELYHAGDCYFSLSLHHDEDFGMAPAEALGCGQSAVLTDWGGYSSFVKASSACRLVLVSRGRSALQFSSRDVQNALRAACAEVAGTEERRARADRFLSAFSIDAAAEALRKIQLSVPPRFRGFKSMLSRLCAKGNRHPFFPGGPGKNTLYPRLYGPYYSVGPRLSQIG